MSCTIPRAIPPPHLQAQRRALLSWRVHCRRKGRPSSRWSFASTQYRLHRWLWPCEGGGGQVSRRLRQTFFLLTYGQPTLLLTQNLESHYSSTPGEIRLRILLLLFSVDISRTSAHMTDLQITYGTTATAAAGACVRCCKSIKPALCSVFRHAYD